MKLKIAALLFLAALIPLTGLASRHSPDFIPVVPNGNGGWIPVSGPLNLGNSNTGINFWYGAGTVAMSLASSSFNLATGWDLDVADNVTAGGNILCGGAILTDSPGQGVGYATGAGGAGTQSGSINSSITVNRPCGELTTVSTAIAGNATATFVLLNSCIGIHDVVTVSVQGYAGTGILAADVTTTSNGQCNITLKNLSSTASNAPVTLNFGIVKAVNS